MLLTCQHTSHNQLTPARNTHHMLQELLESEPDRALIYSFWRLPLLWLAVLLIRALCICCLNPLFKAAGTRPFPTKIELPVQSCFLPASARR